MGPDRDLNPLFCPCTWGYQISIRLFCSVVGLRYNDIGCLAGGGGAVFDK